MNHDIDTDLVRFEHDECDDAELIGQLCDLIDQLRFDLVTRGEFAGGIPYEED